MSDIDTVFFDIGDVLMRGGHKEMFLAKGMEYGEKERAVWEDYKIGRCSEREYWNRTLKDTKFEGMEDSIMHDFRSEFERAMPGPAFILAYVVENNGYNLGIISNHSSVWARTALKALRLDVVFKDFPVVISEEVCYAKPQKEIYAAALLQAGRIDEPERCVFIDDLERNVLVARELGMNAVQCIDENQVKCGLRSLGVRLNY